MNKIKQRRQMKALMLANELFAGARKFIELSSTPFCAPALLLHEMEIKRKVYAINNTPSNLFMCNKPKLDPRRVKRHDSYLNGSVFHLGQSGSQANSIFSNANTVVNIKVNEDK